MSVGWRSEQGDPSEMENYQDEKDNKDFQRDDLGEMNNATHLEWENAQMTIGQQQIPIEMKLPVSCVLYPGARIDRLTEIKDKLFVKLGSLGYNQHERLLKRFGNLQQARSSRSNSAL